MEGFCRTNPNAARPRFLPLGLETLPILGVGIQPIFWPCDLSAATRVPSTLTA